jgi:antitoxin component YwqK of YwqJK toxin-antitoxin module
MPFKLAVSTNNGATWVLSLPLLDKPASDYTAQPIASAFRGPGGMLFFAMDAAEDNSFLWQSSDGGARWRDLGGRTGARHSAIIPLDDQGHLLSIGGKNGGLNGWSPMNLSSDWGASWDPARPSVFPALSRNQRPCLIRLANGHLCIVTDSYASKTATSPPGWALGEGCVVGISTNQGVSWHCKRLPVELPHERDRKHGTLGYATVRQAPNGVIHVLATMTHPCLHYEFNEAWVFSRAGNIAAEARGGQVQQLREDYPGGKPRITWSARICADGRYLLDGPEVSYYANGRKEHEVTYEAGRKAGRETLWDEDGTKLWAWDHNPGRHTSVWTHFWPNGQRRIESTWNTNPKARDLGRKFTGLVADGPVKHWDAEGKLLNTYRFKGGALVGEAAATPKR